MCDFIPFSPTPSIFDIDPFSIPSPISFDSLEPIFNFDSPVIPPPEPQLVDINSIDELFVGMELPRPSILLSPPQPSISSFNSSSNKQQACKRPRDVITISSDDESDNESIKRSRCTTPAPADPIVLVDSSDSEDEVEIRNSSAPKIKIVKYSKCVVRYIHYPRRRLFDLEWKQDGEWKVFKTIRYSRKCKYKNEKSALERVLQIIKGE